MLQGQRRGVYIWVAPRFFFYGRTLGSRMLQDVDWGQAVVWGAALIMLIVLLLYVRRSGRHR